LHNGKGSAYLPIVELLHSYFEIAGKDSVTARREKAELYRLKGELALRTGSQNGDAEEHFRRAIGTARHQLSKAWELRATTSLACFCKKQGRRDEARQMLSDAHDWFTEGFDTPDLKAAKALLNELDAGAV